MTEAYVKSIIVEVTEWGAHVGVKDIMHETPNMTKRGGILKRVPMVKIAEWMEYGTTRSQHGESGPAGGQPWHIPPRPHWRPAQQKFIRELGQLREKLTHSMYTAMKSALERELNKPYSELSDNAPGIIDLAGTFKNEPATRGRFKIKPNKASRIYNKYRRNAYVEAGMTPPEDLDSE
jgi:hypothetical protein